MPRTKVVRTEDAENVRPKRMTKFQKDTVLSFLQKAKRDAINKLNAIDVDDFNFKLQSELNQIIAEVPTEVLEKTLSELRSESEKSRYETATFKSFANDITKNIAKNSKPSATRIDPLTAGRSRRRSKSQMTIKIAKAGTTSRSLSRIKIQHTLTSSNSKLTPAHSNILLPTGTITPKIKANTPSVILRRPRQGEMAVSMQGSPLMVSGVSSDQTANINIPLQDGCTVSILPNRGLRKSELPELDLKTIRQMEALRDNLIRVCDMG